MSDDTDAGPVTRLLEQARRGDSDALERVFPLVYEELRRVADRHLRREGPGHTLQPTALVNEAYLKLVGGGEPDWQDRAHFVAVAARAMRQVLVDHARRRSAAKRGGDLRRTTLGGRAHPDAGIEPEEVLALDRALRKLETVDPRLRRVVEYRYFGGLQDREIGELLGVTARTVQRDWARARAWLYREMYPEAGEAAGSGGEAAEEDASGAGEDRERR